MGPKRAPVFKTSSRPFNPFNLKKQGHPVSAMTKVAGRRIAGSQRAEQARQQKRRDSRRG